MGKTLQVAPYGYLAAWGGMRMGGIGWFPTLKRAVKEFSADDMMTYAAAVSYQVFF